MSKLPIFSEPHLHNGHSNILHRAFEKINEKYMLMVWSSYIYMSCPQINFCKTRNYINKSVSTQISTIHTYFPLFKSICNFLFVQWYHSSPCHQSWKPRRHPVSLFFKTYPICHDSQAILPWGENFPHRYLKSLIISIATKQNKTTALGSLNILNPSHQIFSLQRTTQTSSSLFPEDSATSSHCQSNDISISHSVI